MYIKVNKSQKLSAQRKNTAPPFECVYENIYIVALRETIILGSEGINKLFFLGKFSMGVVFKQRISLIIFSVSFKTPLATRLRRYIENSRNI
jgi:hypothetical protein